MTDELRALRIAFVLWTSLLLLAGCGSMPQNMRERFPPVPPRVETFEADARTTFSAAQLAFKRLDFNLTRTSLTGFRVEASKAVNPSVASRDSRRLHAYLGVEDARPNECEVSLRLITVPGGRGLGASSQLALREHDLYAKYFAVLQDVLAEHRAAGAPRGN